MTDHPIDADAAKLWLDDRRLIASLLKSAKRSLSPIAMYSGTTC
jgi:hypothetical protein